MNPIIISIIIYIIFFVWSKSTKFNQSTPYIWTGAQIQSHREMKIRPGRALGTVRSEALIYSWNKYMRFSPPRYCLTIYKIQGNRQENLRTSYQNLYENISLHHRSMLPSDQLSSYRDYRRTMDRPETKEKMLTALICT